MIFCCSRRPTGCSRSMPKQSAGLTWSARSKGFPMTKWTSYSRHVVGTTSDMSNLLERLGRLTQKQLLLLAFDQQRQLEAARQRRPDAIAVIGIGCRFPGGGDGPRAFWELLREGRDAIREVPGDRWDIDSVFDADPDAPARMSVRSGGFLDEVGEFDAAFFGIAPREALTMDPQQRLLLEV